MTSHPVNSKDPEGGMVRFPKITPEEVAEFPSLVEHAVKMGWMSHTTQRPAVPVHREKARYEPAN